MSFNIRPTQPLPGLQARIDGKTKPPGSLGQLEKLARQVGEIQQTLTPSLAQPHLLVFAGDHGAARAGVSAYPQEVTWQMVDNFLNGGAAINVFARHNDMSLQIIDAGVAHDFGARAGLIDAKIAAGTQNYLEQPAMSFEQCRLAIERGAAIVRELARCGCQVVACGEMGIGNTAAAALLTHCLTGVPLVECIGRGTGLDDAGLARKKQLLAQAVARAALPAHTDPRRVLAEFGGFEIAMICGALLAGAEAGMLLLIDGFIVTAALMTAVAIVPTVRDYCVFCHRSAEPGHRVLLNALQAEPLLDLGLRLGEGTGAALAWSLVRAAVAFLNEMASFSSAGVSERA